MANVSDILGVGPSLEFEGVTYHVKPLTFELQAKFEQWLRRRALKSAQEDFEARQMSRDAYNATLTGIRRDWAGGVYAYGGEVSIDAMKTMPGIKEFLRLSLSKDHPEVDAEFIDRMMEAQMEEVSHALAEANADPLPKTPPTAKSGAA
jgi:hypothetical protein